MEVISHPTYSLQLYSTRVSIKYKHHDRKIYKGTLQGTLVGKEKV
jgi:hypothetical protein